MKKAYLILLGSILLACNSKKATPANESIAAKVYDFVLTEDELKSQIPVTNSIVDSLKLTKQYVEEWAKQKLLYRNALINLDNTEDLDRMVNRYKEDLYVSYYKNALVNKKLDTLVFQKEIDSFYVKNQANFRLNEVLVQFKYIHLEPNTRKISTIKRLFVSEKEEDRNKLLTDYDGVDEFYLNDSTWVSLNDVYKQKTEFPTLTTSQLIRVNRLTEIRLPDRSTYLIYLNKVAKEGDVAPLVYVEKTIKNILLHKNKMKFFDQMEQILIEDAVKQKKYEVY